MRGREGLLHVQHEDHGLGLGQVVRPFKGRLEQGTGGERGIRLRGRRAGDRGGPLGPRARQGRHPAGHEDSGRSLQRNAHRRVPGRGQEGGPVPLDPAADHNPRGGAERPRVRRHLRGGQGRGPPAGLGRPQPHPARGHQDRGLGRQGHRLRHRRPVHQSERGGLFSGSLSKVLHIRLFFRARPPCQA